MREGLSVIAIVYTKLSLQVVTMVVCEQRRTLINVTGFGVTNTFIVISLKYLHSYNSTIVSSRSIRRSSMFIAASTEA